MTNNFDFPADDKKYPPKKASLDTSTIKLNQTLTFGGTVTLPAGATVPTEFNHNAIRLGSDGSSRSRTLYELTGKKHIVQGGFDDAQKQVLGEHWQRNTTIQLVDGFVQGAALYFSGGTSAILRTGAKTIATNIARNELIAEGGLLVAKGLSSSINYHYVGTGGHGYDWGESLLYGFGGQIKFGNLAAFQKAFKAESFMYKLAHTSHEWHKWAHHSSQNLLGKFGNANFKLITLGDGTVVRIDASDLYTSFGFDQLEKQWLTGLALYKGKFGQTSYEYQIRNGGHSAEGGLEHSETTTEHEEAGLVDSSRKYLETNINAGAKFGNTIGNIWTGNDPNRNVAGKVVDSYRAIGQYFGNTIDDNNAAIIVNTSAAWNRLLTSATYGERFKAVVGLSGTLVDDVILNAYNLQSFGAKLALNGVESVLEGVGGLANTVWVSAQNFITDWTTHGAMQTPADYFLPDDVKVTKNPNGTTTIEVKKNYRVNEKYKSEESDVQRGIKNNPYLVNKKIEEAKEAKEKRRLEQNAENNKKAMAANNAYHEQQWWKAHQQALYAEQVAAENNKNFGTPIPEYMKKAQAQRAEDGKYGMMGANYRRSFPYGSVKPFP
jgi:hypothetical protein